MKSSTGLVLFFILMFVVFCIAVIRDFERTKVVENDFKQKYDSLENELKRTIHERDAFNIRLDSLNLHNKTLLLENDSLTGELGKIKDRYKTKTTLELQKLMIDGAK